MHSALLGIADVPAAGPQPGLPLLPVGLALGLPTPAVPATPIRFGEQLRQSLDADALATLNLALPVADRPKFDEALVEQAEEGTEDEATHRHATDIPEPDDFHAAGDRAARVRAAFDELLAAKPQLQNQLPVAPVSQPTQSTGPREQTLLNVLAAVPETSALGALTINTPALSMATKGTPRPCSQTTSRPLPVTQLSSLTNAGLAQALVQGFNQQPGVLVPVSTQPAQPLNTQRSALEVALGDRLQLQITQRSEHAVIRLDPPSMGTIEIVIQREAGNIQVHLRASNAEVARQLQGIGDSLRQDLIHRQNGDVSVHVLGQLARAAGCRATGTAPVSIAA